jgi:Questin oxidase-like
VDLLNEIHANKKLSTAAEWGDGNKIRDGIMKRAPEEMIGYASQWSAKPEKLEDETAEMISAVGE